LRRKNAAVVEDALGKAVDWRSASSKRLVEYLADKRPAVRDRAQEVLVARGKDAIAALSRCLHESDDTLARQLSVWTLCRIEDDESLAALRRALSVEDEDVAIAAVRALGRRGDTAASARFFDFLNADETSPAMQLAVAEALATCGDERSLPALWQALAASGDATLEHTIVHAIHHLASADQLQAQLAHPHAKVKKAALVLLAQPPRARDRLTHEMVLPLVASDDFELRQAALGVLQQHPEWTEPATRLLTEWLDQPQLTPEQSTALCGTLLAFQSDAAVQKLIAARLAQADPKSPAERRVEILQTLQQSSLADLPPAWIDAVAQCIGDADAQVQAQAVRTAAVWQMPRLDRPLMKFALDEGHAAALRVEALRAVVTRSPQLEAASVSLLMEQLDPAGDPLARLRAAEVLGRAKLEDAQRRKLIAAVRGDALISPEVVVPAIATSTSDDVAGELLSYLEDALKGDWRPTEETLEQALKGLPSSAQTRAKKLQELRRERAAQEHASLTQFEPLLTGGDAQRGQAVFSSVKAACASCHRVGTAGGQVGPDLTRIGAIRSPRDLLESIVLPSSTFAQGFENYTAVTSDGQVLAGVIARQDDRVLVLRNASGGEARLERASLESLTRHTKSLMPEGLPGTMTPEQFRDLLAYLRSLR
jgi:putative heme-binding domain-containing protein